MEQEERYRKIFESSQDAILVIDPERDILIDFNPRACTMLGYSHEQLLLARVSDIHPEEMAKLRNFARSVINLGRGQTNELTCLTKEGRRIPTEISASSIDIAGRACLLALVRDISGRKHAEATLRSKEEKCRWLLDSAPDAVVIVDGEGRIHLINSEAEQMFGFSRDELIGQTVEVLLPEHIREGYVRDRVNYMRHPTTRPMGVVNTTARRKDGSTFPVDIKLGTLETESEFLVTSIIRDVTDRKLAEDALKDLAVLEERNRLARDIHDALGHGLLGIIWQLNWAESALGDGTKESSEALKRARALAEESLTEARRSVSSLRAGPLRGRSLREVPAQETEALQDSGTIQASFVVTGEERDLSTEKGSGVLRICQEALANVRKHSNAKNVHVTLAFEGSNMRLSVQDDGVGFDPETASQSNRDQGGFGLTSMTERADLLGGELRVRSEVGKGTLVEATIPLP